MNYNIGTCGHVSLYEINDLILSKSYIAECALCDPELFRSKPESTDLVYKKYIKEDN